MNNLCPERLLGYKCWGAEAISGHCHATICLNIRDNLSETLYNKLYNITYKSLNFLCVLSIRNDGVTCSSHVSGTTFPFSSARYSARLRICTALTSLLILSWDKGAKVLSRGERTLAETACKSDIKVDIPETDQ